MKEATRIPRLKNLGLLGAIALSGFLAFRFTRGTRHDADEPPGSLGLPVIGETLSYVRNPYKFFETRVKKYGPVFKTRLLGKTVACFTGPKGFTFFANQASFRREGANPGHIRELLCQQSLPLIDGPEHQSMRSLVMQAFDIQAVPSYVASIEHITQDYLKQWEGKETFAWVTEYKKLSASLCAALLLGEEYTRPDEELVRTLETFMAGLTALPINLPFTKYGRALRSRDRLLSLIDGAIRRNRNSQNSNKSILTGLLNARDGHGKTLSEGQLRAQMVHMFFAAYGGIFRVLTLLSMSLAQNPSVKERARSEIIDHFPDGAITLERLLSLSYLDQVTLEVRRLNRIFASTFFDWVTESLEYNGFHIPEGWKATGGIYTTMQDGSVFSRPDVFDPDRFGPERVEADTKENSYIPQGGGPVEGHRCPAEDLTTILMKAVGVLLLRDYDWHLLTQVRLTNDPSPMPRDGLKVRFSRKA